MQQGIIYGADFFGDHGLHVRGDVREDHGKFVSADSGKRVPAPEILTDNLNKILDIHIAFEMPVFVVDILEAVQIQIAERVLVFSIYYLLS